MEIEAKVTVAEVKGWIDALFKATIFEFKLDIEKERPAAKIELKKYFGSRPKPSDYIALLTDGLLFEVYQYDNGQAVKVSDFKLSSEDPLSTFRYLDQFIFSSKPVKPRSTDIVQTFGSHSSIFTTSRLYLESMYDKVQQEQSVKTKVKEWKTLLAKVYGADIGDAHLFTRHTYLIVLSRLLVAKTLYPEEVRKVKDYKGLMTGDYFTKKNLPNLVEPDFFSWAINTIEEEDFLGFLVKLEGYLKVYDLRDLSEDVLKELYQNLVDPESRHSLGEYYTPDWLAEIILENISYYEGVLLDPSCGSGTFLFSAIKRKKALGLKGDKLLDDVLSTIIGIDVHPLAVMMSKVNVLLALSKEIKTYKKPMYLQVYLADTLLVTNAPGKDYLTISVSKSEQFAIPLDTIERTEDLNRFIDKFTSFADTAVNGNTENAFSGLLKTIPFTLSDGEGFYWKQNFKLMTKLIKNKRDTIWSFILKNAYRPAFLRLKKVDFIVGNPPWLSYRYIKDPAYKERIKDLTFGLGLLQKTDVKLFTQMDTSTVFFRYCEQEFLTPAGQIAFVMPKTTILPAKQHALFQEMGMSEIYDLSGVSPLFNVRAAVLFHDRNKSLTANIPITFFSGVLPVKNVEWKDAKKYISKETDTHSFLDTETKCPYYHQKFFQGATIVPRCFWFVQPMKGSVYNEEAPFLETSEEANAEAKKPWVLVQRGQVEKEFLFETVLAKGLLPFAIVRRELIFLPAKTDGHGTLLMNTEQLLSEGKEHAAQWMIEVERIWEKKRASEGRSIYQWLDYNNKLAHQNLNKKHIVLYNTSGKNLAAALHTTADDLHGFKINGFAADAKTYYYYAKSQHEGDYLCAVLNSNVVNDLIKDYQPQGLYGERDIHRRPFEVCPIPPFNEENEDHMILTELGMECRKEMAKLTIHIEGKVGRARLEVRRILAPQIAKINAVVEDFFKGKGLHSPKASKKKKAHPLFDE